MKLSAIKLETSVITDLYKKNLVEPKIPDWLEKQGDKIPIITPQKKDSSQIHFLGENKKNILVLVHYNQVNYMPDEELAFLTNMLSACKLSLTDVAIMNIANIGNPSYKEIAIKITSSIILLFGTTPSTLELPVDFPHFQVQSFNNCMFLYTPSLEEIKNDKILKSKLWVCLRKIFNL